MRYILLVLFLCSLSVFAQQKIQIAFVGDVMGHDTQINSARIDSTGEYDYYSVFKYIKEDLKAADILIANLEVTLAGPPHKGYPQFSSPDTLVDALLDAGVDAFVMANNHCVDRRKKGLERTLKVLDQKGIPRTGVFKDSLDRVKNNPLIIEKKGFRLALLNYTYGTNGIRVSSPNIVNQIDTALMSRDIALAQTMDVDEIIVCMHWGWEYQTKPNPEQKKLTQLLWNKGINVVIGSHPHVVQPMVWKQDDKQSKMVAYSLGNFVSNQRKAPCDGGVIAMVELTREADSTYVSGADFQLTWVHTPNENGKKRFYVLPAARYSKAAYWPDAVARKRMNEYIGEARAVFKNNVGIEERKFILPAIKLESKGLEKIYMDAPEGIK
ncbi:CapA family protein [Carboxylicivirga sp. N1Y90]|uniref:CapA family protein n=1 Tax=Carboxylicivirga fragile TaxID=3417571 RepID=UPI003D3340C6|nr:CapA family protein [Marinilabiliaceae bacterium N1Y90]